MSLRLTAALIGGASILMQAGCATHPTQPTAAPVLEVPQARPTPMPGSGILELEKPGEEVRLARSGRFVIQASPADQPEVVRGGQGRFEWLSMAPVNATDGKGERQIMTWQGPLGRTLASLERRPKASNTSGLLGQGAEIRAFDAEGLMLNTADQQRMLVGLLGSEATRFNEADITTTLTLLMVSIEKMSRVLEEPHEFRFRIQQIDIVLLLALDPV